MEISEEKLSIITWVVSQKNPAAIQAISRSISSWENLSADDAKIVGYRKVGWRVSKKEFVESLKISLAELSNNQIIPIDKLEADSDKW